MKVESGRKARGDVVLEADVVVVGTGAGGSVVLRECARAGLSVIGLEEGGYHTWRDFSQREEQMFPKLFQEGGGRLTQDRAIRVLQGRGVGGSTVHNTNLCKRTPDAILELWAEKYSVSGARPRDLAPSFEAIERDLSVATIPEDAVNANNDVLRRGAQALGWASAVLKHNRVGCQQSGFCELGCAYDAKQNALKVLLPDAEARGAQLHSDVRVTAITMRDGRATGVRGEVRGDGGEILAHYTVRAKVVVLAASAVGSAELVLASSLPDPHGQAGRRLRMHPGAVVAGLFEHDVAGYKGIPQSVECTEHLSFEEGSPDRTWIIPAFAHPIGTATTLPGFGKAHMAQMRNYRKLAVLTAMLHDQTAGEVAPRSAGSSPKIHYRMIEEDRAALARGLVACGRLLFAAGAKEITIPAVPSVRITRVGELDALDTSFVRPHGVPLSAVHPMGTLRMGDDPHISVVSSQGEHHQVRGLFVADGSLFPTSLGGPPQISIYAFALHLSPHIVAAARR